MVPVSEVAMFGLLQSSLSAVLLGKSVRVLLGLHIEFFCSVFAGSWTVLLNKTQRSTKILNITLQYCRFTNFYSTLQKVYRIHIVILIVACSTVLDYFAKTNEQTKRFANEKTRNDSQTKRTNTKRFANTFMLNSFSQYKTKHSVILKFTRHTICESSPFCAYGNKPGQTREY